MAALEAAITQRDEEQVRIQAHTIKGAAGNISALRMRATASAMEEYAREGQLDAALELRQTLKDDFAAFNHETTVEFLAQS
jgi:HPt (histidine-containing phosphotransfer) domain-containing protein